MKYAIDFHQVTVKYGNHEALSDVTLRLDEEKIYGLIGRNGAGKTTLLSLIASFREQSRGTVAIGGKPPFESAEVMQQVAFVYDTDYREEAETARGLLQAAERYRPNFDRDYAHSLANLFRLPLNKKVKELSKGQKSALNATIGLAGRTPITIFDEAYLGMDAPTRESFYKEVLEDHASHPRTIILSTHLVSEMEYLFEEAVILHHGKLLLQEPMDQLLERGSAITGAAQDVDAFVSGMTVLNVRQLGGTKMAMIYGELGDDRRKEARRMGLEIGAVTLQDLFIHLTSGGE
jgi:ABC-2 type transport system ATP-binding protein